MEEVPQARKLLTALRELGPDWHARSEIASHLGKRLLNPAETTTLDMLAAGGVIERDMRPLTDRPMVNQYLYRLK